MQSPLDFFYRIENIDPVYYYNYATKEIVSKCNDPKNLKDLDLSCLAYDPCFMQSTDLKCIDIEDIEIIHYELQDIAEGALFKILSQEFDILDFSSILISHDINKLSTTNLNILKQLAEEKFLIPKMDLENFSSYILEMDSLPLKDNLLWKIGFISMSEYRFKWKEYILNDFKIYFDDIIMGYVSIDDKIVFTYDQKEIKSTDQTPDDLKLRQEDFYLYRHMI